MLQTIPVEIQLTARSRQFIEALIGLDTEPALSDPPKAATPSDAATSEGGFPRIGDRYMGGIYAGLSRGEGTSPDGHIILLDDVPGDKLEWNDAVKWALELGDGARLPTRDESALLYANLRAEIGPDGWVWTGTQYSAYYAWTQYFLNGLQLDLNKSYVARARAVRRFNSLVL